MDYFTKWPEADAISDQEASSVAEALVTDFFCHIGIPSGVITMSSPDIGTSYSQPGHLIFPHVIFFSGGI
jgi:hypothetical protein